MTFGAWTGLLGALGGVALGAWLSARFQRQMLKEGHYQANREARANAYIEFLSAYRAFRRFLMSDTREVRVVEQHGIGGGTPVVEGAVAYWEAVEAAAARLEILAGGGSIDKAAREVVANFFDLARARASHPKGEIPEGIVQAARDAEKQFSRTARYELEQRDKRVQ